MKTHAYNQAEKSRARAFTLIEMVGVLAVIAILAAMLIPRVTNAIDDARINNTIGSCESATLAVTDHYFKYNGFNLTTNGATLNPSALTRFDNILMLEGLLDKPFSTKVGTNGTLQVSQGGGYGGTGYKLDGTNYLTTNMTYVVEAVLTGVQAQDAYAISSRLDGPRLLALSPNVTANGRCCYQPTNGGTFFVYLAGH